MPVYLVVILLLLSVFTILGIRKQRLLNPLFVFNVIWLVCFVLYALNLSSVYTNDVSIDAFIVFLAMIFSFNLLYLLGLNIKHKTIKGSIRIIKCENKYIYLKRLFYIWLVLTVIEAIYCRSMPLVWLIIGRGGNYATFGIPSLHGFINSLSWFVLNISFIYFLNTHDKRVLRIIIIINVVYVFLLARQSMTTEAIQFVGIYTLKRKVKFKRLIGIALLGIIGFGVIGNIRTNPQHVLQTSGLGFESFPYLLMGFVWVYLYLMTPIANIIYLINNYSDFLYGVASARKFLPSAIVNIMNLPSIDINRYLVRQTYNVSTSLVQPYVDFGVFGIIIFFGILGYIGSNCWQRIIKHNSQDIDVCNYSVYLGILALTFFSNMLLSLPIIMQFFYTNILFKNYFEHSTEEIEDKTEYIE